MRIAVLGNLESLKTIGRRPAGADRDMEVIHPEGTAVIGRGVVNVERNAAGEIVRVYGVVHDLTEQRRLEEAAQREREALTRADKMISLGVLVSGVAHEINNPNYAILLNTPLLRKKFARDSEEWEMVDDIEHSEQVLVNLVINACQALEDNRRAIAIETGACDGHFYVRGFRSAAAEPPLWYQSGG